jgi:hypothetical protein
MVHELETAARAEPLHGTGTDDLALANRAARALERLQRSHGMSTADGVRSALLTAGPAAPPPNTMALASLDWPLVLTTNYDHLYVAAVHQLELNSPHSAHRRMDPLERRTCPVRVVGRSAADCHRVLTGISHVGAPAAVGVAGPFPESARASVMVLPAALRRMRRAVSHVAAPLARSLMRSWSRAGKTDAWTPGDRPRRPTWKTGSCADGLLHRQLVAFLRAHPDPR